MNIMEKDEYLHGMILTISEAELALICCVLNKKNKLNKKPYTIPPNPPKSASLILENWVLKTSTSSNPVCILY